jgi:integrase
VGSPPVLHWRYVVLSPSEVQQLLDALALRERTLVLLDVGTGLRMSELFGLKWKDVDFDANEISVVRSIVMQVTGRAKQNRRRSPRTKILAIARFPRH